MCISMQLLMAKQTLWYVCRGVVIFTDEVWCSLMSGGLFGRYLISSLMLERSTVGTEMLLERGKKGFFNVDFFCQACCLWSSTFAVFILWEWLFILVHLNHYVSTDLFLQYVVFAFLIGCMKTKKHCLVNDPTFCRTAVKFSSIVINHVTWQVLKWFLV